MTLILPASEISKATGSLTTNDAITANASVKGVNIKMKRISSNRENRKLCYLLFKETM